MKNTRIKETKDKRLNSDKFVNTPEFVKFSDTIFDEKLKQANLATKADIVEFI